jgi:6-phosphogluconolactonase (cycloisomerase 2 family)
MRLNITGLMRNALPLAALLLLAACPQTTSYTIGGTVTGLASSPGPLSTPLILQNNGGDNLTISANGAFTFATAVTSTSTTSATYNVTILTQPFPQTCIVTGGSGTASSNVTSVVVSCSSSSTSAYVVNKSGTVSQYPIGANGALPTTAASSVATGTYPYSIAVVPSGLYAYVANDIGNNVSEYTISSGVLTLNTSTANSTGTVNAGLNPVSVTVDPTGQYAYVANYGDGTVSQYTIGTPSSLTPGALAPMSSPTVLAGSNPISVTVAPSGSHVYVYVANYSSGASAGTVSEYSIGTGGALATIGTVGTGKNPSSVTVDPSGQYAYVANLGDGTVSQYTIGTPSPLTPGALAPMSSPTVLAGSNPISVTVAPSGSHVYVYVANYSSGASAGTVSEYSIGTGGALATIGTVGTGKNPSSVTVDPSGQYAYVANLGDGTVSQYTISSGVLSANTTIASPTGTIAVSGQPIAVITAR